MCVGLYFFHLPFGRKEYEVVVILISHIKKYKRFNSPQ